MLPAGLPKLKAAGFCEPAPSKLNGLSAKKVLPPLIPDLSPPNKFVPRLLAGSLPLSSVSPVVTALLVAGAKRDNLPVSPLPPKTELDVPNAVAVLTGVSVDEFEVFNEVKKLGALELEPKVEGPSAGSDDGPVVDETVSDVFTDDSDHDLAEVVSMKEKGDVVGEVVSTDLEPPKLKADLGGSDTNTEDELGSFVFGRLKGAGVEDEDCKENPLGLTDGVAPNVNALSLAEDGLMEVEGVVEKAEKVVGGFGIANWGVEATLSVVAVEPKIDEEPDVDDGALPRFEALSNSD